MTTTADVRPGTVPAWAIRYAYDGEEWLVLGDRDISRTHHDARSCRGGDLPHRYAIGRSKGLTPALCCGLMVFNIAVFGLARLYNGDSLDEAHAAFDRLEAEWIARER